MISKEAFAAKQDHAAIGTDITRTTVDRFIDEALHHGFGTVYVNPCDVAYAKERLSGKVLVGAGAGATDGVGTTEMKIGEGLDALDAGADCLDLYMNVSRLKDGDDDYVRREVSAFVRAMREKKPDVVVKVIIECPYLNPDQKRRACEIVALSGADYVKQSSGTQPVASFVLGDVAFIKHCVKGRCKVKAAGSIVNLEDALAAIDLGADCVGNDQAPRWMAELGDLRWVCADMRKEWKA